MIILQVVVLGLALFFLSGSIITLTLYISFIVFWLIPLWFQLRQLMRKLTTQSELVSLLSFSVSLIIVVPYWIFRKTSGLPFLIVDLSAVIVLVGLWVRSPRKREFIEILRRMIAPADTVWLGLVFPLLFCLVWLGFEVQVGQQIRYYGLFLVDFGNLSSYVSLIKVSPSWLPLGPFESSGILHYHWIYFTLPALVSTWMGNDIPSSNALVLCNLLTISFFYKVLSYAIGQSIDGFRTRRYLWEANGSGLIILASSMVYTYQTAIAMVNLPWLTLGERNNNLLTLINSGINFGNNTFALALSFLGYFSLVEFRKTSLNSWAATAVLCWSLVLGYSITLCFTLGLAGFLTFVSGKIKKPLLLSALSLCIVSIIYLLFHQLGYFDGGQGARLAFGFDDGRFIQNAIFSFPLIMIGLLLAVHQGLNWFSKQLCIGVVVCFLIPSLIYIKGTGTLSDFSMKTSSLMVAMGGTVAVSSFHRFLFLRSAGRIWRLGVILLVFCGLANTAAYVLQFPYYRIINPDIRFEAISLNYFNSLKYIRLYAKQDSLLIDGMGYHRISVVPPVMIAERRILKLPDNDRNNMNPAPIEGVNDITSDNWKNWASSGFKDKIASEYFAGKSEYFLTLVPMASSSWRLEAKFGDVMIYKSLDYN